MAPRVLCFSCSEPRAEQCFGEGDTRGWTCCYGGSRSGQEHARQPLRDGKPVQMARPGSVIFANSSMLDRQIGGGLHHAMRQLARVKRKGGLLRTTLAQRFSIGPSIKWKVGAGLTFAQGTAQA